LNELGSTHLTPQARPQVVMKRRARRSDDPNREAGAAMVARVSPRVSTLLKFLSASSRELYGSFDCVCILQKVRILKEAIHL